YANAIHRLDNLRYMDFNEPALRGLIKLEVMNMLTKNLWIVLALALSVSPVVSQRVRRPASLPSLISESALRAHIKFLSDDRLEGRGTGARGGELAALYCAEQFEAMGLRGAGRKGNYFQEVSLVGVKADPKTELRVSGARGSETFKFA